MKRKSKTEAPKRKKSKRFNEISDPEFESVMKTVSATEMTGAVPFTPESDDSSVADDIG